MCEEGLFINQSPLKPAIDICTQSKVLIEQLLNASTAWVLGITLETQLNSLSSGSMLSSMINSKHNKSKLLNM